MLREAEKDDDPIAPNAPEVMAAFEAAPETVIAEVLDGELFTQPRPARPHVETGSVLIGELYAPFRRGVGGPGGWVILNEPEIRMGARPDIVVPDLAGWRAERMPSGRGPKGAPPYYDLAPDWVCEILSPSTEARDRGKKMRIYRREAVRHAWLVNPVAETLEVYRLVGGQWTFVEQFEGDSVVRAEPFEAIELSLSLLWGG